MKLPSNTLDLVSRKIGGIGVVCGLEIYVQPDCSLLLTEGYGITSSGVLLQHPTTHFKYWQVYEEPHTTIVIADQEVSVQLCQLLEEKNGRAKPLTPQALGKEPFFEGKVGMLLLEPGYPRQIAVVLIEQDTLAEILLNSLPKDDACLLRPGLEPDDISLIALGRAEEAEGQHLYFRFNRNTALVPIELMRFGFARVDRKPCDPADQHFAVSDNSLSAMLKEYNLLIVDAIAQLEQRITVLHTTFSNTSADSRLVEQGLFFDVFPPQERAYLTKYIAYLGTRWNDFAKDLQKPIYTQYFYAFVRDLINTYNEIVTEMAELMNDCCPPVALFPSHLLLGPVQEDIVMGPSVFRHTFRQPPIYQDNARRLRKIRFLHWRMAMMIKCFYIPGLEPIDDVDNHYTDIDTPEFKTPGKESTENVEVTITPAQYSGKQFDEGTIPYYYYTANDPNAILSNWSFTATEYGRLPYLYSYHSRSDEYATYTNLCSVKQPFSYDLGKAAFYRIEGHVGRRDIRKVIAELEAFKLELNLDFSIGQLRISDMPASLEPTFIDVGGTGNTAESFGINPTIAGAEHLGGVPSGGTFILLIKGMDENSPCQIVGDLALYSKVDLPDLGDDDCKQRTFISPILPPVNPGPPPNPVPPPKPPPRPNLPAWAEALSGKAGLQAIDRIGPKISGALIAAGIKDYSTLAKQKVVDIQKLLDRNEIKTKASVEWIQEAKLAAAGKWEALGKFQQQKKKGT